MLPILRYDVESRVIYRLYLCLLGSFPQRCLLIILNVHWNSFIIKTMILKSARILNIDAILKNLQSGGRAK